jgi:hypothetical protein
MLQLLLIAALIFFAVIAPIKTVAITIISILLVVGVVKISTKLVSGHSPTITESFNAVVLSCVFAVIAVLALGSLSSHTGSSTFTGISAIFAIAVFFGSYALGFSTALGTKFSSSLIIAAISTVVSQVLFSVLKPMI